MTISLVKKGEFMVFPCKIVPMSNSEDESYSLTCPEEEIWSKAKTATRNQRGVWDQDNHRKAEISSTHLPG